MREREQLTEEETSEQPATIEHEEQAAAYVDGIYYGTGKGFDGNIKASGIIWNVRAIWFILVRAAILVLILIFLTKGK